MCNVRNVNTIIITDLIKRVVVPKLTYGAKTQARGARELERDKLDDDTTNYPKGTMHSCQY